MNENIVNPVSQTAKIETTEKNLIKITDNILFDTKVDIHAKRVLSVPIAELVTLGTGVSSLIPSLNTIKQTVTTNTQGLFRIVNAEVGDTLKSAGENGAYAVLKKPSGRSVLARLQEASPTTSTVETVLPPNPATMMMAVTLASIEKRLNVIEETQKQILSFLEIEKESEIEADVETLVDIVKKYKLNWDNEHYLTSSHKLVLDIQRTARKNMNVYQKRIVDTIKTKKLVTTRSNVNSGLETLEKAFKYYRLALYTFSLASLLEIMLSGNFAEEYITGIRDEILRLTEEYRALFARCSVYLEKMNGSALDTAVKKGLGSAGESVGKIIGGIPVIKNGPVDELLQNSGLRIKENAVGVEKKALLEFAGISNPRTSVFMEQMEEMIQIYNHTSQVCFDHDQIYLVGEN